MQVNAMKEFLHYLKRALVYAKGLSALSKDDWLLVSFPKSGNTWVRMLLGNLISVSEKDGRVLTLDELNACMPELGYSNLSCPWAHECIPRVIKTHRGYNPLFSPYQTILVLRDPRDVMVSFYHYAHDKRKELPERTFSEFIRDKKIGLPAWFKYHERWLGHSQHVLRYEDLKENDEQAFRALLNVLGASVGDSEILRATENSRFDKLKKLEADTDAADASGKGYQFFRSGKSQEWRLYFEASDIDYYESCKQQFPGLNALLSKDTSSKLED